MSDNANNRDSTATKQAVEGRDEHGRFSTGNKPKTGFHTHPERRSNGSWKKENTPRAKLEKMLADMTVGEFLAQTNDQNVLHNLNVRIGDIAVSSRLANIFDDPDENGRLKVNSKEFDALMYFIYGHRSESDTTARTEENTPIIKGFVIPMLPEGFDNYR